MDPQKPSGIFPSSYHPNNTPPNGVPTDSGNTPPKNSPGKKSDMILGIVIGILQVPLIYYIITIVLYLPISYSNNSSNYSLYAIPIVFVAVIIVEGVILRKKRRPDMARGILIGTVLIPVLAFGACLLILSGMSVMH